MDPMWNYLSYKMMRVGYSEQRIKQQLITFLFTFLNLLYRLRYIEVFLKRIFRKDLGKDLIVTKNNKIK